jgi:hypothetical protein
MHQFDAFFQGEKGLFFRIDADTDHQTIEKFTGTPNDFNMAKVNGIEDPRVNGDMLVDFRHE